MAGDCTAKKADNISICVVCPESRVHFYIVTHCMRMDMTSWTMTYSSGAETNLDLI